MPSNDTTKHIDQLNYESTASQHARVRQHLLEGKSLTALEALHLYGCMRLAAIVLRLRKREELNIVCEMMSETTAEGAKQWARYFLDTRQPTQEPDKHDVAGCVFRELPGRVIGQANLLEVCNARA